MTTRVLLAGHCSADDAALTREIAAVSVSQVTSVESISEALEALRSGDYGLVLANRVFEFTNERGVDLVRAVRSDPSLADVKVMLVSNFADAQAEAIAAGAVPGFGKRELGTGAVVERLAAALGDHPVG